VDRLPVQLVFGERTGAGVLDQEVRRSKQSLHDLTPLRGAEVDADAALAGVQ
jgi:hypothetical protein